MSRREFLGGATLALGAYAIGDTEASQNQRWRGSIPQFEPPYRHSLRREFGAYSHDVADWYKLRSGLDFTRIRIYSDGRPVDSLAIVRADPEKSRFRVFHDGRKLKNIEVWQEATGADVVFNSSYYRYDMTNSYTISSVEPATLIITDGKMKGPKVNKSAAGMFAAEPRDDRKPKARIIDFSREQYDWRNNVWDTGVQSWPMLRYADGRIGVKPSNWYANRTAICDDNDGNILAVTAEGGFFSLHQLGKFLGESKLGIRNVLNMDGGYEADMAVRMPALHYVTYGQWETQGSRDISVPGSRILLPAVVGIFPR